MANRRLQSKPPLKLKRPFAIRVMVSEAELQKLQETSDKIGMALSVFLRVTALEEARSRAA